MIIWPSVNNVVTYDYGVFEHTQPITRDNPNQISEFMTYTRECQEILELDYGVIQVPMLLCSWVQTTKHDAHATMWKNEFKFTLMNFKKLLSPKVQPFGQAHPWVVPQGKSHLDFPRPIKL